VAISHHVSSYLDLLLGDLEEVWVMVDATLGNGHDALKLKERFPEAMLYGFDVQKAAVEASTRRLNRQGITTGFEFFHQSHEKIGEAVRGPVDLCLFNLGYLPGGDKGRHTAYDTTVKAVTGALAKLSPRGLILLTLYPGSLRGRIETILLEDHFRGLDQKAVTVMRIQPVNQKNDPPYLMVLKKNSG